MTLAPDYTYMSEPAPTGEDTVVLYTATSVAHENGGYSDWLEAALYKRAEMGREKYGDYLRINNGRRALVDYLQEQLDAIMYATQAYLEIQNRERFELLELALEAARKTNWMIEKGL